MTVRNNNSNWDFTTKPDVPASFHGTGCSMSELDKLFGTTPDAPTMLSPENPTSRTTETVQTANSSEDHFDRGTDCSSGTPIHDISIDALLNNGNMPRNDRPRDEIEPDIQFTPEKDAVDWAKVAEETRAKLKAENDAKFGKMEFDVKKSVAVIQAEGARRLGKIPVDELSDGKVLTSDDIPIPEGAVNAFGPVEP